MCRDIETSNEEALLEVRMDRIIGENPDSENTKTEFAMKTKHQLMDKKLPSVLEVRQWKKETKLFEGNWGSAESGIAGKLYKSKYL